MDYEKKYKEALNWMKDVYPTLEGAAKEDAEHYFPELKENKDERIRKALIDYFRWNPNSQLLNEFSNREVFAYLEKQGKNNMGISEATKKKLEDNLNKALEQETPESWNEFLEKQGEQKTVEEMAKEVCKDKASAVAFLKSTGIMNEKGELAEQYTQDEQNHTDKVEPKFKVKYAGSEYNVLEVKDIAGITYYGIEDEPNHIDYVQAENCEIVGGYGIKESGSPFPTKPAKFSEQNPVWSDEELAQAKKDAYNDALDKIEYHSGEPTFDDGWSAAIWYLKKRNIQPKQEWSQTDNELADDAIACVERCYERYKDNKEFYLSLRHNTLDIKRWLINVRKRLTPQWKPSDEQIKTLEFVIESLDDMLRAIGHIDNFTKPRLEEVLAALKKLREE